MGVLGNMRGALGYRAERAAAFLGCTRGGTDPAEEKKYWYMLEWRGGVVRVRTASSSSALARLRCRQTWCTPMTMESMENRTEHSEAVCGRGLMFYV